MGGGTSATMIPSWQIDGGTALSRTLAPSITANDCPPGKLNRKVFLLLAMGIIGESKTPSHPKPLTTMINSTNGHQYRTRFRISRACSLNSRFMRGDTLVPVTHP